jgi:hypothetical protein
VPALPRFIRRRSLLSRMYKIVLCYLTVPTGLTAQTKEENLVVKKRSSTIGKKIMQYRVLVDK